MKKIVLIKFGGSIMAPEWPDKEYLLNFCNFVKELNGDYRFILVTGGGGVNKRYNEIAKEVGEKAGKKVTDEDLDWIGIYATRFNARLLMSIFGPKKCYPEVITDPHQKIDWEEDILVGAGWKPGWSTDYDAMILAHSHQADKIIVATNTEYVFDKDPKEFPDAKPLEKLSWEELKKMVGDKWTPRMHIPLDPSATEFGAKNKMQVLSLDGRNLENMGKAIRDEDFVGTVIG